MRIQLTKEGYPRHCASLEDTEEGASRAQPSKRFHKGRTQRDEAESADQKRDIVFRAHLLEDDIARHLYRQVDDVEDT
jgi:hypothetical protein